MKTMKITCFFIFMFVFLTLQAQENNKFDFQRIEDNSFLLEEAYNQEAGVIQHISTFQYDLMRSWNYSFTQEWPVPNQKHQLSFTIPVRQSFSVGIGDILLNYRYQAIRTDQVAFSPRVSLILPTGNSERGMGYGVFGYQVNLPLSVLWSRHWVTHFNLGATVFPNAKYLNKPLQTILSYNYGASVIWLVNTNLNLMLEFAGVTEFINFENQGYNKYHTFILNPGIRYAFNFKSGLQIVPGLSIPINISQGFEFNDIFLYLSFEHPLWE